MLLKFLLLSQVYIVSSFILPVIPNLRNKNCVLTQNLNMIDRRNLLTGSMSIPLFGGINKAFALNNDELNQIDLYEKTLPSVCYINTEYDNLVINKNPEAGKGNPQGIGTGYLWDVKGHIITNFHVINNAKNASVIFKDNKGDEKKFLVKITGVDPDKDIAVLKIDVNNKLDNFHLSPILLSSNKDIRIGQNVFAIGNPFGQDFSFSMGIVSGLHRKTSAPSGRKITEMIQTDAAINPGNSGGPLIDTNGKLVGMSTSTMGIGVSSGVNFAVSVDTIKNSVTEIINNGSIRRAVLGISYLERRPSKAEAADANIPFIEKGVIILDVPISSPAYSVGLLGIKNMPKNVLGDVIIGIDDYIIDSGSDLLEVLDHYKPDDRIILKILRGVEQIPITLEIILGSFNTKSFSSLEIDDKK